jgi:hypothetical protein
LSEGATLVVDNDMCFVTYGAEDEYGYRESEGFNYDPKELVFMLCHHLGISADSV